MLCPGDALFLDGKGSLAPKSGQLEGGDATVPFYIALTRT